MEQPEAGLVLIGGKDPDTKARKNRKLQKKAGRRPMRRRMDIGQNTTIVTIHPAQCIMMQAEKFIFTS